MNSLKIKQISELYWKGTINDSLICEFEYFKDDNNKIWINNIATSEIYQNKGYATQMLKSAIDVYKTVYVSNASKIEIKTKGLRNDFRYTNDELGIQHPLWIFIEKCIEKDIFKKDWIKHPFKPIVT